MATLRADAFDFAKATDPRGVVDMHLGIARRLLAEGAPSRAFGELVRASRSSPITGRLAAALTSLSLQSGTESAALTLLNQGVEETDSDERIAVRRALARLQRRSGNLEAAREQLVLVLAERPFDNRARRVLNALLEREQRWDELDASLEKETKEALRRGLMRRASRSTLRRARLWAERLENPARAALRYGQAAQYSEQAKDDESAFLLRVLWLRSLHQSQAPERALKDAVNLTLHAAGRVGKSDHVRALAYDLRIGLPPKPVVSNSGALTETEVPIVSADGPWNDQTNTNAVPEEAGPEEAGPADAGPAAPAPRRRSTQIELLAVAAAVEKKKPEVAALLAAAVQEGPDPQTVKKLEAHFIARRNWAELAQLYRDQAAAAKGKHRSPWLEKLAELLESELNDPMGAARAWAELSEVTGDHRAVAEQVRLHAQQKDNRGARQALDEAVSRAKDATAKATALVARAEESLTRKDVRGAREDFSEAVRAIPLFAPAWAGLAELAAGEGNTGEIFKLKDALAAVPRRKPGRGELFRRLARLADHPLQDPALGRTAWAEVLAEIASDEEAQTRLQVLARAVGDTSQLEQALRAQIAREPRGPKTRLARIDLVAALEQAGKKPEALEELRQAVRFEPGHQEAWLKLADKLLELQKFGEAGWALEHGATATENGAERLKLWQRLAKFASEKLKDHERARIYAARAEKLEGELEEDDISFKEIPVMAPQPRLPVREAGAQPPRAIAAPPPIPAPKVPARPSRGSNPRGKPLPPPVVDPLDLSMSMDEQIDFEALGARLEMEPPLPPRPPPRRGFVAPSPPVKPPPPVPEDSLEPLDDDDWEGSTVGKLDDDSDEAALSGDDDFVEIDASEFDDVEARPPTRELPVPLGEGEESVPPSWGGVNRAFQKERESLLELIRQRPLESEGYQLLAEHFDASGDPARASLMLEIGNALDGDPHSAPRTPKLILSATDRAGLRHPTLRGEPGELLALAGVGLCKIFPTRGAAAGSSQEFRMESGKGARPAADALLAAVRILGTRAPEVFLSNENGPPFALVYPNTPRLLVGKLAVKKVLPDAELRFFAGRALFTQSPDLLALRSLRREQLTRAVSVLGQVLKGQALSAEARALRDGLPPKSRERLKVLHDKVARTLDIAALSEGARHSANRAGLVVCGGVAPALFALRAKKALPSEVIELVKFAASDRYLNLRTRKLAKS